MLADTYLTAQCRPAIGEGDQDGPAVDLLPLTVPENRHLLASLVGLPPLKPIAILRRSIWYRFHQQRAGRSRWRQRTRRAQKATRAKIRLSYQA